MFQTLSGLLLLSDYMSPPFGYHPKPVREWKPTCHLTVPKAQIIVESYLEPRLYSSRRLKENCRSEAERIYYQP